MIHEFDVVSKEGYKEISEQDYNTAKMLAEVEYNKMFKPYYIFQSQKISALYDNITQIIKDRIFMNSKYSEYDYVFKTLVANNIAFNNDENFIAILVNAGYSYGNLVLLVEYFQKLSELYSTIDDLNLTNLKIASNELNHIKRIRKLMQKYYRISDYQLIANKITEIVVFKKDLYLEHSINKTR